MTEQMHTQEAVVKPLEFFIENVDKWGAAEWFDRLAKAIREQDKALLAKDEISFETYRMIAASSAMTLVREFEKDVRSALVAPAASSQERIAQLEAVAKDALAGWRYIRAHHGDLYGVGWGRVEAALTAALGAQPLAPEPEGEWIELNPKKLPPSEEGPFLCTNNIKARNAHGRMSHVFLVSMFHKESDYRGPVMAFEQGSNQTICSITHYQRIEAPAAPERIVGAAK